MGITDRCGVGRAGGGGMECGTAEWGGGGAGEAGETAGERPAERPAEEEPAEEREKHNPARDLLAAGHLLLGGAWRVREKIGTGGFGQIYSVERTDEAADTALWAAKVERAGLDRESISTEVKVLRAMAGKAHFPRLEASGRAWSTTEAGGRRERLGLVVMELVSMNLSELRRSLKAVRLSGLSLRRLGLQCLDALRDLHQAGWLHRDVKPSNWALGLSRDSLRVIKLLDFGLARRFVDGAGAVKPARDRPGFRGTVRYASLRAHRGEDLGRSDDLISLWYMLLEMGTGALPWRRLRAKEAVQAAKESQSAEQLVQLFRDPLDEGQTGPARQALRRFHSALLRLPAEEEPDYAALHRALRRSLPPPSQLPPLDWERAALRRSLPLPPVPNPNHHRQRPGLN